MVIEYFLNAPIQNCHYKISDSPLMSVFNYLGHELTPIPQTKKNQSSCGQNRKRIPKDEDQISNVKRIDHHQGHTGHQDDQVRNT